MSNFIQVTPFMHVEDLERALTFFTDILGFEVPYRFWSKLARTAPRPIVALRITSTFVTLTSSMPN